MVIKTIVVVFAYLAASFVFWKKLKEDYVGTQIFSLLTYVLIATGLFQLIAHFFLAPAWFWLILLGIVGAVLTGIIRFKMRVFETVDATVISFILFWSIFFLHDSIVNLSWFSFAHMTALILISLVYYFLNNNYKRFVWYRSGKVGLAGLVAGGLYFLVRGVFAFLFPFMLSFFGSKEILFSGIVAAVFFASTFYLSLMSK